MTDVNSRASASITRRVCGSFGFRAVASMDNDFDPTENLAVCKALGMSAEDIEGSVDLYVDSLKPKVDRDKFLETMADLEDAEEQYDAIMATYEAAVENKADLVESLTEAFENAEPATELSENASENLERVTSKALGSAQQDFIRTGNVEWFNAVKNARDYVHTALGASS